MVSRRSDDFVSERSTVGFYLKKKVKVLPNFDRKDSCSTYQHIFLFHISLKYIYITMFYKIF